MGSYKSGSFTGSFKGSIGIEDFGSACRFMGSYKSGYK